VLSRVYGIPVQLTSGWGKRHAAAGGGGRGGGGGGGGGRCPPPPPSTHTAAQSQAEAGSKARQQLQALLTRKAEAITRLQVLQQELEMAQNLNPEGVE
jgi:hypothetical protein